MGCHKGTPRSIGPYFSPELEVAPGPSWPPVLQGQVWLQPTVQRNKSVLPCSLRGPHIRLKGANQFPVPSPLARLSTSHTGWGSSPGGTVLSQVETPGVVAALTGVLAPTSSSDKQFLNTVMCQTLSWGYRCERDRPKSLPSWGSASVGPGWEQIIWKTKNY